MRRTRIGVYVFTAMVKARVTKKREAYFDGQNYIGLRYILSQIPESEAEITYVSKDTVNTVDWVFISLTSYYDVLNIISELGGRKITAKVYMGGAGYNNVGLLRDIADVGCVGRGEDTGLAVIRGEPVEGLYYRETNRDLTEPIAIRGLQHYISIDDSYVGKYEEHSLGCPRKCLFCEYSWKHKYVRREDGYRSGLMNREVLFGDLNWSTYHNKDLVTAIDGATEQTRRIIGKPISNRAITDKMLEIYDAPRDYVSLKLYCLLGYPFERDFAPEEAVEAILAARREGDRHRANVLMVSPHFMPMPFTPMECEPVSWINFREKIQQYDFERFGKGNINVFWPWRLASSPINAAEATVLNRADVGDMGRIRGVLCSPKYRSLDAGRKRKVLEKYFGDLLGPVKEVLPYIRRNNPTEKAKARYLRAKEGDHGETETAGGGGGGQREETPDQG